MKIVLPDTNIILWTFNGGIDFREAIARVAPDYEIKIPTCVINELKLSLIHISEPTRPY